MKTLDDLFNEEEARPAPVATAAERARIEAKRAEEVERGIRLGWLDANGDPIEVAEEEDDEEEDDEI